MLDILGTLFGAATGGGLLGAIAGLAQKALDAYHQKQIEEQNLLTLQENHRQELLLKDKELQLMQFEASSQLSLAELDSRTKIDLASYDALKASHEDDKATYATGSEAANSLWFIAVDFIRGIIRPFITLYLTLIYTICGAYVTHKMFTLSGSPLLNDTKWLETNFTDLISSLLFMTSTVVLWWFGTRPSQKGKD